MLDGGVSSERGHRGVASEEHSVSDDCSKHVFCGEGIRDAKWVLINK